MAWYNSDWLNRIKITVDATKVAETVIDFPVYLNLSDLPSSFFSKIRTDGGDIRITQADGETELPVEVVGLDVSTEIGSVFFKADLSSSSNTEFYIYYNNSNAVGYDRTATYGLENVWNSNYQVVYHLAEPSSTDAENYKDSTSNALHAVGGPGSYNPYPPTRVDGELDKAAGFNGVDQSIRNHNRFVFDPLKSTVQAFIRRTGNGQSANSGIVGFQYHHAVYQVGFRLSSSNKLIYEFWSSSNDLNRLETATSIDTNWMLAHGVLDQDTGIMRFYVNGVEIGTLTPAGVLSSADKFIDIGAFNDSASGADNRRFEGEVEEYRMVLDELTPGWISTEQENFNSSSTFYSIGSEEVESAETGIFADLSNAGQTVEININAEINSDSDLTNAGQTIEVDTNVKVGISANLSNTEQIIEVDTNVEIDVISGLINTGQNIESGINVEVNTNIYLTNVGQNVESNIDSTPMSGISADLTNAGQGVDIDTNIEVGVNADLINISQIVDTDANVEVNTNIDLTNVEQNVESNTNVLSKISATLYNAGQLFDVIAIVKNVINIDASNVGQTFEATIKTEPGIDVDLVNAGQSLNIISTVGITITSDLVNIGQSLFGHVEVVRKIEAVLINSEQVLDSEVEVIITVSADLINAEQIISQITYSDIFSLILIYRDEWNITTTKQDTFNMELNAYDIFELSLKHHYYE